MQEMLYVVLSTFFPMPLFFTLVAAIKFSCYSSNEIGLLCFVFFFLSLALAFSVIHANVDFKIKLKERIVFVVVVFSLQKSGWLCDLLSKSACT